MNEKRQNAELRKPDILKHYYQVILEEGVEGASIAKVAKRMKINPSLKALYAEFIRLITRELEIVSVSGKISIDDPEQRAKLVVSMIEGYRHFKHFYIEGDAAAEYKNDMKKTLKYIITG
ncbi:MAG TPA: hypothetical protein PK514_04650 [Spirochaetota bacterium]|nr:hypothetical protein [Spirochaetota bacterium]